MTPADLHAIAKRYFPESDERASRCLAALQQVASAVRAEDQPYMDHKVGCNLNRPWSEQDCTCGLAALLTSPQEKDVTTRTEHEP